VIPALLALIQRLATLHEVHVFALMQEDQPGVWDLLGARIHNIGRAQPRWHTVRAICAAHRVAPFDLVQAIWSGAVGMVAVIASRILRIPSLVHIAGGDLVALPEIRYGGALKWRGRLCEAVVLRATDVVTAASVPTIQLLARRGLEARRVPLGVALDSWPPRAPVPRTPTDPIRLIHVASLNPVKDQATLLRALAALRQAGVRFTMDIVGEDTMRGEIQGLAQRLEVSDATRFHGFLTQRQLRPLLEAAHLMVLSSRHETGPLALLEAAVAGVPTVGTEVGHLAEWAPEAAVTVPVGNWSAMANAIAHLAANEDHRLEIAREAQQRAIGMDADHTASRFHSLYAELLR
jgi:glycosyltransferase involved in cell wall biosynthesis